MNTGWKCKGPRKKDSLEREGCGVVLTPLIEAIPQDGGDWFVKCPSCGRIASIKRSHLPHWDHIGELSRAEDNRKKPPNHPFQLPWPR